jgi:uncharacterized membrane protein YbhN (UPF0104 family)
VTIFQRAKARAAGARFVTFVSKWLERRGRRPSARTERVLLAIAIAVFVGITVAAYRSLPETGKPVRWIPLVLVIALGVPATVILNAAEYKVSARILGHDVRFLQAVRIGILASTANQLPIPGSVVVRVQALKQLGSTYKEASSATAIVGLVWIGMTGVLAGSLLLPSGDPLLGLGLLLGGILSLVLSLLLLVLRVDAGASRGLMLKAINVEIGSVLVTAFRLYTILFALGFTVSFPQALALTTSVVVASATAFFPAGLGMRELLAAGVSRLVDLPAAVGVVASAIDRVLTTIVLSLVSLPLLVAWFRGTRGRARET